MDELKAVGCIERIGGKRYGKWGVKEHALQVVSEVTLCRYMKKEPCPPF